MNITGPKLWEKMHKVALFEYPQNPSENDKTYYTNYYKDFWKDIPCLKCKINYRKHWEELPITNYLESPERLFEWTVLFHNIVNKELGKKVLSLNEALNIYKPKTNYVVVITAIVLLLILLALLLVKKTTNSF